MSNGVYFSFVRDKRHMSFARFLLVLELFLHVVYSNPIVDSS